MTIILVIVILILINGFFAASEMALVSISPSTMHKIKQEQPKGYKALLKVKQDSTKYLSTIQVAITFSGFLSSAFAGSELAIPLQNLLLNINITLPTNVLVVIITLILSFFTLVLGELVPKRIAMNKSTEIALFNARVINVFMVLFTPFVWLLTKTTNLIVSLLGFSKKGNQEAITEQEIKEMIVYGHIKGLYQKEERNMLERIFRLDDITAKMVMTSKDDVIGLDITNITEESYHRIIHSRYTRIPIFKQDIQHIVGVIHIKDILLELDTKTLFEVDLSSLIREPLFTPSTTNINVLLQQMKNTNNHLVFVEEDKHIIGIITLEDIVEEITGSIYDEHDTYTLEEKQEFTYIVSGTIDTTDLNKRLGRNLFPNNTTLKDIILQENEKPKKNDVFLFDQYTLTIIKIDDQQNYTVRIFIQE